MESNLLYIFQIISDYFFEASDESGKDEEKIPTKTRTDPVSAVSNGADVTDDVITSLPDGTMSCKTHNLRRLQRSTNMGPDSAHVTSWNGAAAPQPRSAGGPVFPTSTRQPLLVQVQQPANQPSNHILFSFRPLLKLLPKNKF